MEARIRRKKNRYKRNLAKGAGVFLCILFLAMLAAFIFRYTEIAGLGREAAELDTRIAELTARKDALIHQLNPFTKKTHVEEIAKNELGMQYNKERVPVAERVAEAETDGEVEAPAVPAQNPTLFGQLSVFVFSLLYR